MEWWSDGVVEFWSDGVVEWWSGGAAEFWSDGVLEWRSIGADQRLFFAAQNVWDQTMVFFENPG
jgi:hypothetical protein